MCIAARQQNGGKCLWCGSAGLVVSLWGGSCSQLFRVSAEKTWRSISSIQRELVPPSLYIPSTHHGNQRPHVPQMSSGQVWTSSNDPMGVCQGRNLGLVSCCSSNNLFLAVGGGRSQTENGGNMLLHSSHSLSLLFQVPKIIVCHLTGPNRVR